MKLLMFIPLRLIIYLFNNIKHKTLVKKNPTVSIIDGLFQFHTAWNFM